jgi:hypothetical protein
LFKSAASDPRIRQGLATRLEFPLKSAIFGVEMPPMPGGVRCLSGAVKTNMPDPNRNYQGGHEGVASLSGRACGTNPLFLGRPRQGLCFMRDSLVSLFLKHFKAGHGGWIESMAGGKSIS